MTAQVIPITVHPAYRPTVPEIELVALRLISEERARTMRGKNSINDDNDGA